MSREDIIRMLQECGFGTLADHPVMTENMVRFAALVAAEKEQQMLRDGWRQCAKGQRTTQHCGLLDAAVRAEREACAKVCEARHMGDNNREDAEAKRCAAAIRSRGEEKS